MFFKKEAQKRDLLMTEERRKIDEEFGNAFKKKLEMDAVKIDARKAVKEQVLDTLRSIVTNAEVCPQDRIRAAQVIMDRLEMLI